MRSRIRPEVQRGRRYGHGIGCYRGRGFTVGVVWQVDKSTKAVADTLERAARREGTNARRVGTMVGERRDAQRRRIAGWRGAWKPGRSDAANKGWLIGEPGVWGRTEIPIYSESRRRTHIYTCVRASVGEFGFVGSLDRSDRYAAGLISKVKGEAEARA